MAAARAETKELEVASARLDADTLKCSLRENDGEAVGKKEEIIQRIGAKVVEIGVRGLFDELGAAKLAELCTELSLEKEEDSDSDDRRKNKRSKNPKKSKEDVHKDALIKRLRSVGLEHFLQQCSKNDLEQFCNVLLLPPTLAETMISQISDEVMLTGTKKFLHRLSLPVLKKWCAKLQLHQSGPKKGLVESVMVRIFQLEPEPAGSDEEAAHEDVEEEEVKKEAEPKGRRTSGRQRAKKVAEEEEEDDDEDDKKRKKGKKTKESEEDEAGSSDEGSDSKARGKGRKGAQQKRAIAKKEKYVAPPLSTIVKGLTARDLHNTFNATDLRDYCKQNGLVSSGKKPLLIKRIIKYLETGEVEVPKGRAQKRKRGPVGKGKKAASVSSEGDGEDEENDNHSTNGEGDGDGDGDEEKDESKDTVEAADEEDAQEPPTKKSRTEPAASSTEQAEHQQQSSATLKPETTPATSTTTTTDATASSNNTDPSAAESSS